MDHDFEEQSYGFDDHIGETVTIFTTSGGQSGCGFTGVVLYANPCFVRLVTRIGPPPGCALGNACTGFARKQNNYGCVNTVGSVVDIPMKKIVAVVYNTV